MTLFSHCLIPSFINSRYELSRSLSAAGSLRPLNCVLASLCTAGTATFAFVAIFVSFPDESHAAHATLVVFDSKMGADMVFHIIEHRADLATEATLQLLQWSPIALSHTLLDDYIF